MEKIVLQVGFGRWGQNLEPPHPEWNGMEKTAWALDMFAGRWN